MFYKLNYIIFNFPCSESNHVCVHCDRKRNMNENEIDYTQLTTCLLTWTDKSHNAINQERVIII
jgi:hypothetical protein